MIHTIDRIYYGEEPDVQLRQMMKHSPSKAVRQMCYGILVNRKKGRR